MGKYDLMSDEQLMKRLRQSDQEPQSETEITDYIMDKYKFLVRKRAKEMYLLGGENDDLIQEGMIGLFKAIQRYDVEKEVSFSSFAGLCITRQIYSAIKASQRKKHLPLNSYVSIYDPETASAEHSVPLVDTMQSEVESNPEAIFLNKEYRELIEHQLKEKLSKLESSVLYLHLLGIDYQTIARIIDKSPKAVDNALQRIKIKTQEILKKEE